MKKKQSAISLAILLVIICVNCIPVLAGSSEGITVYYTNDIHSYIDNNVEDENGLTYSKVAALKASTEDSLLVDAGDHIQGTAYGGSQCGIISLCVLQFPL